MANVTAFVPLNGYLFLIGSSLLVDVCMIKAINYRRQISSLRRHSLGLLPMYFGYGKNIRECY
jgi:hypothetical protein